jgi:hypothetical protein
VIEHNRLQQVLHLVNMLGIGQPTLDYSQKRASLLLAKTLTPQSLEQAVWLFVDEWLAWFDSYAKGNDGAGAGEDDDGEVKKRSHVGERKRGQRGLSRSHRVFYISPSSCASSFCKIQ